MALFNENKFDINTASTETVSFEKSEHKWSLYMKDLTLKQSFDGLFPKIFNPKNEIYFFIICWDYSGKAPFIYPPKDVDPESFKIVIKKNKIHQFGGDGLQIWPYSNVVGTLNTAIILMEDDTDIRNAGKTLSDISKAVNKSKLFELITAVASNPATITGVAIAKALSELTGLVGSIMSKNKNDYINLFQGSYGVENHRIIEKKPYPYKNAQAEMNIELIVGN